MKAEQLVLGDLGALDARVAARSPQLVLLFGPAERLHSDVVARINAIAPAACVAGCSTAAQISADGVTADTTQVTLLSFDATAVVQAVTEVGGSDGSRAAGQRLGDALVGAAGLRHVLVFAPGVDVNGSALIAGLVERLPANVGVSGGLAGDGAAFVHTCTVSNRGVHRDAAVAVGLCGDRIVVGNGSFHGWTPFGPLRRVTRSQANRLYELDGEPALDVYRRYLGDYARELPSSGLLFPFELVGEAADAGGLIRTILGIDESAGMLVLAGDVPEGGLVRLMHATTASLAAGAQTAAEKANGSGADGDTDACAVLVSCVGRKLVMGSRVDDEVEAACAVLGPTTTVSGFYAHGEIGPGVDGLACRLHNQTMTITRLSERP